LQSCALSRCNMTWSFTCLCSDCTLPHPARRLVTRVFRSPPGATARLTVTKSFHILGLHMCREHAIPVLRCHTTKLSTVVASINTGTMVRGLTRAAPPKVNYNVTRMFKELDAAGTAEKPKTKTKAAEKTPPVKKARVTITKKKAAPKPPAKKPTKKAARLHSPDLSDLSSPPSSAPPPAPPSAPAKKSAKKGSKTKTTPKIPVTFVDSDPDLSDPPSSNTLRKNAPRKGPATKSKTSASQPKSSTARSVKSERNASKPRSSPSKVTKSKSPPRKSSSSKVKGSPKSPRL
jgi:hypothetical protein